MDALGLAGAIRLGWVQAHSLRQSDSRTLAKSVALNVSTLHEALTLVEILLTVSELHDVSKTTGWQTGRHTCRSQLRKNR
jgi:hypothetical protein